MSSWLGDCGCGACSYDKCLGGSESVTPPPPQPLVVISQGKETEELLNVFKGKFIVSNFTFQVRSR